MKIALLNTVKPSLSGADAPSEYTFQLYSRLGKGNKVDAIYPLERSKRNDIIGLVYTNSLFKLRLRELAKEDYDVIHIANQELGFAAKMLKRLGAKAMILTSIHDLKRVPERHRYKKNLLQDAYNNLVTSSIHDALSFSDLVIFTSASVQKEAEISFRGELGRHAMTLCPANRSGNSALWEKVARETAALYRRKSR